MDDKTLIVALHAIGAFMHIDPSDGGPQDNTEMTELAVANVRISEELQKRGYKVRSKSGMAPFFVDS